MMMTMMTMMMMMMMMIVECNFSDYFWFFGVLEITLEASSLLPLVLTQIPADMVASRIWRWSKDYNKNSNGRWIWLEPLNPSMCVCVGGGREVRISWLGYKKNSIMVKVITWASLRQPASGWSRSTLPKSASFTKIKLRIKIQFFSWWLKRF